MIELLAQFKVRQGLRIAVFSNEARELNAYRIQQTDYRSTCAKLASLALQC
jgi:hypothetical protein